MRGIELLLELESNGFDRLNIFRRRFERNVFAIFLESEAFVLCLLLSDDCPVEQCGWIVGLRFERRAKEGGGFIGAAALTRADTAESIQSFGVLGTEVERVLKSFF